MELARATPYSMASIRRLQRGLITVNPEEAGKALTEDEAFEAVPVLLKIDMVLGGRSGLGAAMRKINGFRLERKRP